jgi:ATP-binding cassette subfamily B protein
MTNPELQRDKTVTRAVHKLFWQGMLHTPRYFIPTVIFYFPAFFIMNVYVPFEVAYGIQAIITRHFDAVGHYALTVLWLTVIGQGLYALATWAFNLNGVKGATFVQRQVFANFLAKDYEFFGSQYIGSLGAGVSRIRDAFTDYNRLALFEVPRTLVIIIASLVVLAFKSLPLAMIAVVCMLVVLALTLFFAGYRLKYRRLVSQASSKVAGVLGDGLSHGAAVKSFANEDYEQTRLQTPLAEWEHAQLMNWNLFIPGNSMRNVLMSVTMAILLLVSAHLYQTHQISIAIVALVQIYVIRLIYSTIEAADMIKEYEQIMSMAYDTVATTLLPSSVNDPSKPISVKGQVRNVEFADVSYHYPEAATGNFAVKDFSLLIKQGEKIGLVGYSGGGKTTITKLLLRFMDVDKGNINLNGVDIRQLRQAELRDLIAYVPQEPLLFHRSIRENIAYSKPGARQSDIDRAAKTAYVDDFLKELPQGYDSLVGERGVKLSGGQRQRVAIARALLKDAPILVLDEATSALDSQSEQYIQKALWELMKDRTAIVIAHRLSTIQRLDRIIVMDKGRIVQAGSHAELLKDKGGAYAKLWAHQSGGYLG